MLKSFVKCQRLDVTRPPSNTMHICVGCQEIIGFYLKPWKSHAHTTTVALQTFINISFWSCMIKPPIFNAFVQCSGGDRCPNDELLFSTGFSDQTRRKWNVELCTQKYSKASFIVFFLDICFLIIVKVHLPHIQKMFLNHQATEISNSMHADCVSKELFKQKD